MKEHSGISFFSFFEHEPSSWLMRVSALSVHTVIIFAFPSQQRQNRYLRAAQIHTGFYDFVTFSNNHLNYTHKDLEDPPHSWSLRRLIELAGNSLSSLLEFLSKFPFSKGANEKTENHNHT